MNSTQGNIVIAVVYLAVGVVMVARLVGELHRERAYRFRPIDAPAAFFLVLVWPVLVVF